MLEQIRPQNFPNSLVVQPANTQLQGKRNALKGLARAYITPLVQGMHDVWLCISKEKCARLVGQTIGWSSQVRLNAHPRSSVGWLQCLQEARTGWPTEVGS